MSQDNDNHFQRFHQKRVSMKMKDGSVRNGFLINSGYALGFLPGSDTRGQHETIASTDVESMTFARMSKEEILAYIEHSLKFANGSKPQTRVDAETGNPFTGYVEDFKEEKLKVVFYQKGARGKPIERVKIFNLSEILDIRDAA